MQYPVSDLKPNKHNAKLFAESLTEASIQLLADDMAKNQQQNPILALGTGTIVDGERRWRAAALLGWENVEVTTVDVPADEVLGRVLGSVTATRHMTLREQTRVYEEYRSKLQREHGRGPGRPAADDSKPYMSTEQVKLAAMKLAHIPFRATSTMDELVAIFKRKNVTPEIQDIQERVNAHELSISKGYELIKVPRPKVANADAAKEEEDAEEAIDLNVEMTEDEADAILGSSRMGETPAAPDENDDDDDEIDLKPEGDLTEYEADEKADRQKAERALPQTGAAALTRLVEAVGPLDAVSKKFLSDHDKYVEELLANDPVSLTGETDLEALLALEGSFTDLRRKSRPAQSFDDAVEALWTLESPEEAIKRLAEALEATLDKLDALDPGRTRLCMSRHVRTIMIRIGARFSK